MSDGLFMARSFYGEFFLVLRRSDLSGTSHERIARLTRDQAASLRAGGCPFFEPSAVGLPQGAEPARIGLELSDSLRGPFYRLSIAGERLASGVDAPVAHAMAVQGIADPPRGGFDADREALLSIDRALNEARDERHEIETRISALKASRQALSARILSAENAAETPSP